MKKERAAIIPISLIAMLALFLFGCEGWQLEYHDPDAQFLADEVASKGKKFIGKKITIKGFVDNVDLSDPDNAWVHLKNGIHCAQMTKIALDPVFQMYPRIILVG